MYMTYCIAVGVVLFIWDYIRAEPDNVVHVVGLLIVAFASGFVALCFGLFGESLVDGTTKKVKLLFARVLKYTFPVGSALLVNHILFNVVFNP